MLPLLPLSSSLLHHYILLLARILALLKDDHDCTSLLTFFFFFFIFLPFHLPSPSADHVEKLSLQRDITCSRTDWQECEAESSESGDKAKSQERGWKGKSCSHFHSFEFLSHSIALARSDGICLIFSQLSDVCMIVLEQVTEAKKRKSPATKYVLLFYSSSFLWGLSSLDSRH